MTKVQAMHDAKQSANRINQDIYVLMRVGEYKTSRTAERGWRVMDIVSPDQPSLPHTFVSDDPRLHAKCNMPGCKGLRTDAVHSVGQASVMAEVLPNGSVSITPGTGDHMVTLTVSIPRAELKNVIQLDSALRAVGLLLISQGILFDQKRSLHLPVGASWELKGVN